MPLTTKNSHLQLAIFRLEDVCVRVQEGMENYLKTAALQRSPEVEATFRWFRKRGIKICLLSGYGRAATEVLLNRLDWEVGEDGYVQMVVLNESVQENPVRKAVENAGLGSAQTAVVLADNPRLLRCAQSVKSQFVIGLTNGSSRYEQLASEPHHALLDSLLQLPNFLLRHLPEAGERKLRARNKPTLHLRSAPTAMRG